MRLSLQATFASLSQAEDWMLKTGLGKGNGEWEEYWTCYLFRAQTPAILRIEIILHPHKLFGLTAVCRFRFNAKNGYNIQINTIKVHI